VSSSAADEMARRLLPWVLAPRFKNVVTSVEVEGEKAVARRNVELYETDAGGVMVPGASMFLYEPYLNTEYRVKITGRDKGYAVITAISGYVAGYMPNGEYVRYGYRTLRDVVGKRIEFTGSEPDQFTVNMIARRLARISAARIFAANIKQALMEEGWKFELIGEGTIKKVYVREGNAATKVVIQTSFFAVYYDGRAYTAPGIVPGVLNFFADPNLSIVKRDDVRERLIEFLGRVSEVGSKFAPVSILQQATRSTFTYVIGEVEGLSKTGKAGGSQWVAGGPAYSGVRANVYADRNGKLLLSLTFIPFSPPASLELNYPPYHIAPLAAMVRDRPRMLRYLADTAVKRLARQGADAVAYVDELEPLADAGVGFDELRRAMKEGYPKMETVETILDKMTRIEDVADVASLTYGEVRKVDELLVSEIRPPEKRAQRKGRGRSEAELADVSL